MVIDYHHGTVVKVHVHVWYSPKMSMMVKDGKRHVQHDVSTLRSSSDECVCVACMQAIYRLGKESSGKDKHTVQTVSLES